MSNPINEPYERTVSEKATFITTYNGDEKERQDAVEEVRENFDTVMVGTDGTLTITDQTKYDYSATFKPTTGLNLQGKFTPDQLAALATYGYMWTTTETKVEA